MTVSISTERMTRELLLLLTETFESVQGFYLDGGTSLFETLDGISAAEASIAVGGRCATVAAQVAHTSLYLEVLDHFLRKGENQPVDWGETWRTIAVVTPQEWAAIQARLQTAYRGLRETIEREARWELENSIAGAIGLVAHCAYHLGEVRQATCVLHRQAA
jgi:hypothetical protein